jgi:hypothetical protein
MKICFRIVQGGWAGAQDIAETALDNVADDCPPPSAALVTLCSLIGSTPAIQCERFHNPLVAVLNTIINTFLSQAIAIGLYGYGPPPAVFIKR